MGGLDKSLALTVAVICHYSPGGSTAVSVTGAIKTSTEHSLQGERFVERWVESSPDDVCLLRLLSWKQMSRMQLDNDVRVA